jgi:hypothetical protein
MTVNGHANLVPAEVGNGRALKHGAYSPAKLQPRVAELADRLAEIVPASSPSDEPSIRLLALQLARIDAAHDWLAEKGLFKTAKGEPQGILKQLSVWENSAARLLDRLGCTPSGRAALGLDIARAQAIQRPDLAKLDDEEFATFQRLAAKAGIVSDDG